MTDTHRTIGRTEGGRGTAFGPELSRDVELGALLRVAVGETPSGDVSWTSLADRISVAIGAQRAAPWWSYATRWERRVIPLALAAGIAAAAALWTYSGATSPTQIATAHSLVTEVAAGTPAEDAASSFAGSVTSAAALTVGVPE
jgi:hypothetical protein